MGRKPRISRETLLDLAEEIVRQNGSGGLTIEALAQAAGVSKGGIQYSFASKELIIKALIERWIATFDPMDPDCTALDAADLVRRYIATIRASEAGSNAKTAALMLSYMGDPRNQTETTAWYQTMIRRTAGPENTKARLAFLALEGLSLLQGHGQADWHTLTLLLDDIEASLGEG